MEMLEGTTLNSKFVAVRVNNEAINTLDTYKVANTTINTSTESRTIAEGYLGADEEVDYTVSFWMDEDATINDDVMNKVFKSKIVINSEPGKYDPVSAGYDTLHDAILANEYQTTPEIAKTKIANKQEVDLSNTAPIIKWVEKTGESTTKEIMKPAESVIKIYNKDNGTGDRTTQASDLTLNDTKMLLYKVRNFNSNTSKYKISEILYADPTTIDYSGDSKYYFIDEYISYNNSTGKLYTWSVNNSTGIYQITSATKLTGKTMWHNTTYDSITYKINGIKLTSTELESDKSDKGLYQSNDDYGATFYYRGNVKNNNVYFAGFYWQIIRINGDGSIRLIYNGSIKNARGTQQMINSTSQFNNKYNSPAYVGYMYGNPEGTVFDEVHANTNNSTIKIIVDDWYKINILEGGYQDYISMAAGFCGDRTLYIGDGIRNDAYSSFGAFERYTRNTAKFICSNSSRDLYTVGNSNIGNGALQYPVGLITYDELVFAGMDKKHVNKLSYVYSSQSYWTMSPSEFSASNNYAYEWNSYSGGYIESEWNVTGEIGARPVINLKSDVKITGGTGSANDPYVVDTNN